jgi:hypothetical protein
MKFMDFLQSRENNSSNSDCDYAKKFKNEFEKLFDNDNPIPVYENLKNILEDWKRDCPKDENLVYADLMVNINSLSENDIEKRIEDVKPLQAIDRDLHAWFLSSVFIILVVYLNDDIKELYPKSVGDNDAIQEFSQKVSQKFNDDPLFGVLMEKSYDDEEIGANTKVLHVTVYSKYSKYGDLKCNEFAEEFERIIFSSFNNKTSSGNVIDEFKLLSSIWKEKCPDDANMACAYIVGHVMELSDEELDYYENLANNGAPVDESRHFILKRSMIGALNVRRGNTDQYETEELDCRTYAEKFKELYEKIFERHEGNDSDDKELADLMFSWDLNCPDDANMILARTLLFHSSLSQEEIDGNITKASQSKPGNEELHGWFLKKTLTEV